MREGESKQAQKDDPGFPTVELVIAVDYRPYKQLDSGLGNQKGVGGENAADASISHTSK